MFSIETKRLILRDYQESDWEIYVQNFKDPLVQDGILSFQSGDLQLMRQFEIGLMVAEQNPRFGYVLAVVLKDMGTLIGNCFIAGTRAGYTRARVGWHFGSTYSGKGYATESARELLRLGFQDHDVERISAHCFASNAASRRVMEKIGMMPHRNSLLARWLRGATYGENKPIVQYRISKSQWILNQTGETIAQCGR
jgi:RimJ/RimL family protein N-acetyltransferase